MYQGVIMAGFGGQGIVSMGTLLAYAGMIEGKHVTFFPSYGAEMRGGTANCSVVVSTEAVASPVVSVPDTVIAMNEPSLAKFEPTLKPGGLLLLNSSLIKTKPKRSDITVLFIPANQIAEEVGNIRAANMAMLGVYASQTKAVSLKTIIKAMPKVFTRAKPEILIINEKVLKKGAETKG
ncbi:MAG: 2-oxoacid:acceptor oxidoreductase family protein [Candidatus Edwardsbacteria bacterium]